QLDSSHALCLLRMGELKRARELADATVKILQTAQLSSVGFLPTFEELGNVYLGLWEEHPEHCAGAPVQVTMQELLKRFELLSRSFPVGLAALYLMKGRFAWRCGRLLTALGHLRKSLQYGEELKMLPVQAWANYHLGRFGKSPLGRIYLGA